MTLIATAAFKKPSFTASQQISAVANSGENQSYLNSLFHEDQFFTPPVASYYNNRARLRFGIATEYSAYFILIKGLIEFSRSGHLRFVFNTDKKLFEIDLQINQFPDLSNLLTTVYGQTLKEIRFKAALKKAIQFEQRYRLESAEVYNF